MKQRDPRKPGTAREEADAQRIAGRAVIAPASEPRAAGQAQSRKLLRKHYANKHGVRRGG